MNRNFISFTSSHFSQVTRRIILGVCMLFFMSTFGYGGDFTGNWLGSWSSYPEGGQLSLSLTQSGTNLTGTFTATGAECGSFIDVPIYGSVSGNVATYSATTVCIADGTSVQFEFSYGTLSGDTINGAYNIYSAVGGWYRSGTYTVTRQGSPTTYPLSIIKTGTGSGLVSSYPSGINCGSTCSSAYASGTSLAIFSSPFPGSCFIGWGAPCSGYGECNLTLNADTSLSATFQPIGVNFCDVMPGNWAEEYIDTIFSHNVTTGCVTGATADIRRYCPSDPVTREQMAAFIVRAAEGEPPTDYCSTGSPFPDCSTDSWSCRYIKKLYDLGLTTGYGQTGLYMPLANVTRAQMAAFIVRAIAGEPAIDYCSSGSPFTDVIASDWSCKYIKRLYELNITTGYGDGRYGPDDLVTRDQMAVFMVRAFYGVQ